MRRVAERQRMVRETLAGREWKVRRRVPMKRVILRGVISCTGYTLSASQSGVTSRIRINRAVSAGRVVAFVALFGVESKFSRVKHGLKNSSILAFNVFRVARISSSVVVFGASRYRLRNMPAMMRTTPRRLPAVRRRRSPYRPMPQKSATRRKDSHGSGEVQVRRPRSQLSACSQE